MQAPSSSSLATGDEELRQVAQRCLDSKEKYSFVVGPSRSGKSTRLPVIMAALSGKKVLCVQSEDWIAQRHAEWLDKWFGPNTYDGQRISVGYIKDEELKSWVLYDDYDVTYVSYRWLYRMVVGASYSDFFSPRHEFNTNDSVDGNTEAHQAVMEDLRQKYSGRIGFVMLDEVHAQSIIQELGYIALHAATSNLVEAPIEFSKQTKVVMTTAYPENNTFSKCFGLSEEQIQQQTIKIDTAPTSIPRNEIREVYVPEGSKEQLDYHILAVQKAMEIFKSNAKARVLLLMDTVYSSRNIARQSHELDEMATVFDLEIENIRTRSVVFYPGNGPIVVLATPSFASRIPVGGITDVICPPSQLLSTLSEKLGREILVDVELSLWELAWAKSHLDPACENPTIHYMFTPSYHSQLLKDCGARFRGGDFVDILLGTVRLCPKIALGQQSPLRFGIPWVTKERALRQLTAMPAMISQAGSATESHWIISASGRTWPMLTLWDRCGLDRRQAFFLGSLMQGIDDNKLDRSAQGFVSMVAILMVVFDENPILRVASHSGTMKTESLTDTFSNLRRSFYLGKQVDFTSDSWINAVVWMDTQRKAIAAHSDVAQFVRRHHKFKYFMTDTVQLTEAEFKIRSLARMFGLNIVSTDDLCDGSFLDTVEKFNRADDPNHDTAIDVIWQSYLYAYQSNLVYVTCKGDCLRMVDTYSGITADYARNLVMLDLFAQAEEAGKQNRDGFYVTGTVWMAHNLRSLTVIPTRIFRKITENKEGHQGSWDLLSDLQLN